MGERVSLGESVALSLAMSRQFATLSGDGNPLHLDPEQARRLPFGSSVVHGLHLVMLALNSLYACLGQVGPLVKLSVRFSQPVRHTDPFTFRVELSQQGLFTIDVLVEEKRVATLRGVLSASVSAEEIGPGLVATVPAEEPSHPLGWDDLSGLSGCTPLYWEPALAAELFPLVARHLPAEQGAFLLSLTRIVGCYCPGLHSVFSGFDVEFAQKGMSLAAGVSYRVQRCEARFNWVQIGVESPVACGTLNTFFRSPAVEQASCVQVKALVAPNLYGNRRVVVVGGGRGLGEVVAKIVSAGGGEVTLTYHQGLADALRVVDEITQEGGRARAVGLDVLSKDEEILRPLRAGEPFEALFYFATPRIDLNAWSPWRRDLFNHYCRYYLDGFLRLAQPLVEQSAQQKKRLVLVQPSTIFVQQPERGAAEYAAAKAALETMAAHLQASHTHLELLTPRLDRLRTDQTASLDESRCATALPVMIDLVNRALLGRTC
ncbi:MAG: SDR family NAD(P)-dependent oxidoreductase [Magnetococcales bacterium]|nr:SDR family NAD(P)-dependent oxidoreductase [Magnetococcales bacterium]